MAEFDLALDHLTRLREIGVRIALDDFGTGHSSLGHVHRLPLDKIKIDRSFVAEIDTDRTCLSIVRTIVELCRNLDLGCVVEGIETERQRTILAGIGCTRMQGYLFGRPMPLADATARIAAERACIAVTRNGSGCG